MVPSLAYRHVDALRTHVWEQAELRYSKQNILVRTAATAALSAMSFLLVAYHVGGMTCTGSLVVFKATLGKFPLPQQRNVAYLFPVWVNKAQLTLHVRKTTLLINELFLLTVCGSFKLWWVINYRKAWNKTPSPVIHLPSASTALPTPLILPVPPGRQIFMPSQNVPPKRSEPLLLTPPPSTNIPLSPLKIPPMEIQAEIPVIVTANIDQFFIVPNAPCLPQVPTDPKEDLQIQAIAPAAPLATPCPLPCTSPFDSFKNEQSENREAEQKQGEKLVVDLPISAEPTNWFLSCFSMAASNVKAALSSSKSTLHHYCIDQDHPWKQQKYQLILQNMQFALQPKTTKHSFEPLMSVSALFSRYSTDHPTHGALEQGTLAVVKALLQNCVDCRMQYTAVLDALRAVLGCAEYRLESAKKARGEKYLPEVDLLQAVCFFRLTENHIYSFCENTVNMVIKEGYEQMEIAKKVLSERNLKDEADSKAEAYNSLAVDWKRQFQAIDAAPGRLKAERLAVEKGKLQGTLNFNFDPHRQGNVPFVLYDFPLQGLREKAVKSLRCLRFGTPTIEEMSLIKSAYINPEFIGYVQFLQNTRQSHVYFSLQNDQSKWIGNEKGRSSAIKELALDYAGTLHVVILSQDSHFYEQKSPFDRCDEAQAFKLAFLDQMLHAEKSGFHFPEDWKKCPEFISMLKRLLDDVHAILYPGQEILAKSEREDFIEIYYALAILFSLRYAQADFFNISCKDAIDRGGKCNSILFKIITLLMDTAAAHLSEHRTITHAPALLTKKQAIIESRRKRLIPVLCRLSDPAVGERLRKYASAYGILPGYDLSICKR